MTLQKKIQIFKKKFSSFSSPQEKYFQLIAMGKKLAPLDPSFQTEEFRVQGCQSTAFLHTTYKNGKILIQASSDALISAGLLALLIAIYSEETPKTILESPPSFLQDLGLEEAISPNRVNGLYDAHLRLKKQALEYLLSNQKKT